MKKLRILVFAALVSMLFLLASCDTQKEYTIIYYVNGVVYDTKTISITDERPILPYAADDGYEFEGWYFSDDGGITLGEKLKKNSALQKGENKVYALISLGEIKNYTIIYKVDDVEVDKAVYNEGDTIVPSAIIPKKTGYSFDGWYLNGDISKEFDEQTPLNKGENIVVALFSPISYKIRFHSAYDFALGQMKEQSFVYDEPLALEANAFSRAGYFFGGWSDSIGGARVFSNREQVQNVCDTEDEIFDLYARWTRDNFKTIINYYDNNEKIFEDEIDTGGKFKDYEILLADGKEAFWTNQDDTVEYSKDTIINQGEINVYAKFVLPYHISPDGILQGYYGKRIDLTVPDVIDGITVLHIGDDAFIEDSSLKTIILPQTVLTIGEQAFSGCTSLTQVELGADIVDIKYRAFYDCVSLQSINLDQTVLENVGEQAFYNCISLEQFVLPDTVVSIGFGALSFPLSLYQMGSLNAIINIDSKLESISLPFVGGGTDQTAFISYIFGGEIDDNFFSGSGVDVSGTTVHMLCVLPLSLRQITVRGGGDILESAFEGCLFVEEIILNSTVTKIGDYAFYACISLEAVRGLSAVTEIGEGAFSNTVYLTDCVMPLVQSIGTAAFALSGISQAPFGDCIEIISDYAFYGSDIQQIILPATIQYIGTAAFYDCLSLENVVIMNTNCASLTIGGNIFDWSDGDQLYNLPLYIWVDGDNEYMDYRNDAFWLEYSSRIFPLSLKGTTGFVIQGDTLLGYVGENIVEIKLPSVKHIGDHAFSYRSELTRVTLPSGLETIGNRAFFHCYNLVNTVFPSSLKQIGEFAFAGFMVGNEMTRIVLPEGFESLGKGAFLLCFTVNYIWLPSTIEYIGYLAFGAAKALEKCYIMAEQVPVVGEYDTAEGIDTNVFEYVNGSKTTIFVPGGRGQDGKTFAQAYREADGFSRFALNIKSIPEGAERGSYADGDYTVVLDGNDEVLIYKGDGIVSGQIYLTGSYLMGAANAITFDFEGYPSPVLGTLVSGVLSFELEGEERILQEPTIYYDEYLWTNLRLYHNGRGNFDMAGYYFTEFSYVVEGDQITLTFDGNNGVKEDSAPPEFIGVASYVGEIKNGTISIDWWLNDFYMEYQFGLVNQQTAALSDGLEGTYIMFENGFAIMTIIIYGNGKCDIYLGSSPYLNQSYTVVGNTININFMTLPLALDVVEEGNLYGDSLVSFGQKTTYYKQ